MKTMSNEHVFVVICWPDVQELMDEEGFEENSTLINDGPLYDKYGDSAYMVNLAWLEKNQIINKIQMKTFVGKFVKNDELPSGSEYHFNTEEEIEVGKAYIFKEYGHPIYVIDILPELELTVNIKGKEIELKKVTLRNETE